MDHFGPLRCPACDYDLRGLPVPHRCPECGTQYDICRTYWRPTISSIDTSWQLRRLMVYCCCLILAAPFFRDVAIGTALLATLFLCGVIALFAYRIQREHVRFDQTGVIVRTAFRETRIPWRRVSHAQRTFTNWQLRLTHPEEGVALPPILAGADAERDFHKALTAARNRWWRQHEQRPETAPSDSPRKLIGPLTAFETCPLCDANIRGLPAVYRCPRCGFAYDEVTRLWKPAHRWPAILVAIAIAGIGVLPIAMFVKFLSGDFIPRGFGSWPVMAMTVMIGVLIWFLERVSRSRYVAAKAEGVYARTAHGERFVPWTDIASVKRRGTTVILLSHRNRESLRLSRMFADENAAEQFRSAVSPRPSA